MKIEFKKSFYEGFDKYSKKEQENIFKTIHEFINSIEKHKLSKGLGAKLLSPTFRIWEIRLTLNIRIIFRYKQDVLEFALVGSHDQIKKYLKNL